MSRLGIRWIDTGWGVLAKSVDEVMAFVSRLAVQRAGSRYLWRGAGDADWAVTSSLQRFIAANPSLAWDGSEHSVSPPSLRQAEHYLLRQARDWGLGMAGATHVDDLQLLAELQHHGVPTRLLDVTIDPMTALWFACESPASSHADGVIFAFQLDKSDEVPTLPEPSTSSGSLGAYLDLILDEARAARRPRMLIPTVRNSRITAQQAALLIGADGSDSPKQRGGDLPGGSVPGVDAFVFQSQFGPPDYKRLMAILSSNPRRYGHQPPEFCALVIPSSLKDRLRSLLASNFGRTAATMFPDISGFADAITRRTMQP